MQDGILDVDNIDVFCEKGVFDVDQSRQILTAGQRLGLNINFHGDELHPTQSAEVFLHLYRQPSIARILISQNTLFSHPLDKNIPFYWCLRFFYPGLLSQPRL